MYRKPNHYLVLFAVMALMSLALGPALAAPVTQSITYQGKLTNAAGSPLTGTYSVKFSLYQASSGGTALASSTQSVTSTNGLFTTPIAFSPGFFDGRALWLGIQVGTDPEMTPRQEIRPVPYALSLRPGALITADGNENGIRVNKSDTGGEGFLAYGEGASSNGFYAIMKGINSNGVLTVLYGSGGAGLSAVTHGTNSPGVSSHTWSSGSHAFSATTEAAGSDGLAARTSGSGSYGVDARTTGTNSWGVYAETSGSGSPAVRALAQGPSSIGLTATSQQSSAIYAESYASGNSAIYAKTANSSASAVYATTSGSNSPAVRAVTSAGTSNAVFGSTSGNGPAAIAGTTTGTGSYGIYAQTIGSGSHGMYSTTSGSGSHGYVAHTSNQASDAFYGETTGTGSYGVLIVTHGTDSRGVYSETQGQNSDSVMAVSRGANSNGVTAYSTLGNGIYAEAGPSGGYAALLKGNVNLLSKSTGASILELGEGLDYSEGFDVSGTDVVAPGTVLVISPNDPGTLAMSSEPYDRKVAGIVAGANGLGSAVKVGGDQFDTNVALAGRVYCNVDATYGAVEPGDQLTTSATPGYAMVVQDYSRAQGATIGKAMEGLEQGQKGQILVLVTLQ